MPGFNEETKSQYWLVKEGLHNALKLSKNIMADNPNAMGHPVLMIKAQGVVNEIAACEAAVKAILES